MIKKIILTVIIAFLLGWFSSSIYSFHFEGIDYKNENMQKTEAKDYNLLKKTDKPSPSNKIEKGQIFVFNDEVIIKIDAPQWAIFTNTKSMDPVIDSTAKAIEVIPKSQEDIKIGDIVAYNSEYSDGIIVHRVIDIGYDSNGWYAILKGDNNSYIDPGKIRFEQIKRVVVAIIY